MNPPNEIQIGTVWKRKRGRTHLPRVLLVRQIYRHERRLLLRREDGTQTTMLWRDLRRDYVRRRRETV